MGLHLNVVGFAVISSQEELNEIISMFPHMIDSLYFLLSQNGRGHGGFSVIPIFIVI